jgi:hypothetical protein
MNIGNQMKAMKVERIGGPAQPKQVEAPQVERVEVAAQVEEKVAVTA